MLETYSIFDCNCIANLQKFHASVHEPNNDEDKLKLYKVGKYKFFKLYIVQDMKIEGILTRVIQSNWRMVQHVLYRKTFMPVENIVAAREIINEAFQAVTKGLLCLANDADGDNVKKSWMKNLGLICLDMIPLTGAMVPIMKKSRGQLCQFYQFIHTFFEVNYYIMMHYYIICGSDSDSSQVELHLSRLIKDFSVIFQANNELCDCVQYFFASIQLISEKVNQNLFWNTFNETLHTTELGLSIKLLRVAAEAQKLDPQFRQAPGRVQPNFQFLIQKFKTVNQRQDLTCHGMLQYLRIVQPLISDLWFKEDSIEVLQVFWEFFSKRLKLSDKNCTKTTAKDHLKIVDMIIDNPRHCNEDFEFFVGMLLHYFKKYPMHWVHMRGRIYSHLGPNKIKDFDDNGLRHVMVLFLSLSTLMFDEMEKRILWLVKVVPVHKKFTEQYWNIYLSMILKFVRDDRNLDKVAPPMLDLLQEASKDAKHYYLIKNFLIQFELIIDTSISMELSQWLLLGSWLEKYHSCCYLDDLRQSLPVFLRLVDKCEDVDAFSRPHWEEFFKKHLVENLKQLSVKPHVPSVVGIIAARLALQYVRLTDDIFTHFTSDVCPEIAADFMLTILHDYPGNIILDRAKQTGILRSWIRIGFVTLDPRHDLSTNIMKLDVVPAALKPFLKAPEPMEGLISYWGHQAELDLSMDQYWDVHKNVELALGNLDHVLLSYLKAGPNEGVVEKFYRLTSQLFMMCHRFIYSRSNCNTIMEKLVEVLILPRAFVASRTTLHPVMLPAIRDTWPAFFAAFCKINTNVHETPERLMKEMVVKYLVEFPPTNSPVMDVILTSEHASVILSKIAVGFLTPPMQQSEANILKAMSFVSTLVARTKTLHLFHKILDKLLYNLFEVVIVHNLRSSALNVVKMICLSKFYKSCSAIFRQKMLTIVDKYMSMHVTFVFQLLMDVGKFVPEDIRAVLDQIKNQVVKVEGFMGVGHCAALRLHFEALQNSVK